MPFEEKATWVSAVVTAIVPAVYFVSVMGQVGRVPVAQIAYQRPLLIAIGVAVLLTIVGAIVTAIVTAIGSAITTEITGEGSPDDVGRKDERDVSIDRRGELVGYYVSSGGVVGAMALTMLEYPHFWIANALYASFVVGSLTAAVVKLVAYRRGF